jgi:hypothetical protein
MIAAIGPEQRFWIYGEETALTIIPSFLISGILSVLLGLLVIAWAIQWIDSRYGAGMLMILSIALFLVGGGFAPIFMALIASLTASRIRKPLTFWQKVLPDGLRGFLGKIWLVVLVAFILLFTLSVLIAIFGWPMTVFFDADTAFQHLNSMALVMVGMMGLACVCGFAQDLERRDQEDK